MSHQNSPPWAGVFPFNASGASLAPSVKTDPARLPLGGGVRSPASASVAYSKSIECSFVPWDDSPCSGYDVTEAQTSPIGGLSKPVGAVPRRLDGPSFLVAGAYKSKITSQSHPCSDSSTLSPW